ncbi:isoprenylcysteine carboxylmethyltransferase family protein [Vibrio sp. SS-MA-C1-2]|uniref:methyltransferase family protein n=1 Tax=Vibrio sp. SS-MA-C1-2 TaxID=2908646 RepID=UPI001F33E7C1|nr:isoprenylcysteine carboxylmethyltransferase family protein [Vibrio sp. SS-MA-C1-2]UJF18235.1 isoprenylcysteine carboxylmethyltransferase family protein [Vibrio sp. SS-MA-C1-2]
MKMRWLECRIPPPILFSLTFVLIGYLAYSYPVIKAYLILRLAASALLVLLSGWLSIQAVKQFRQYQTTVNPLHPENSTRLVSQGVYALSRNPMYLSLAIMLLAWVIFLGTIWGVIVWIIFVLFITRFQIMPEERYLLTIFKLKYSRYCQQVRRWF